jgi:hypothetical protein
MKGFTFTVLFQLLLEMEVICYLVEVKQHMLRNVEVIECNVWGAERIAYQLVITFCNCPFRDSNL